MANLHQGVAFSPQTTLSENIGAADTIIKVSDSSVFPDPPNYATIGTDELGETIEYAAKAEGLLSGCTRGVEGTVKSWQKGDVIARNFTAKDHNDLISAAITAQQTANNATSAATAAQNSADNAQSTANTAKATAEAALPLSGGTLTGMLSGGLTNEGTEYFYRTTNNTKFVISKPTASTEGVDLRFAPSSAAPQTASRTVTFDGVKTPVNDFEAANKIYVDSSIVRTNLLDNACFLKPVNQRASSEYNGAKYTIDRWKSNSATGKLNIEDTGVRITATGSTAVYYIQIFEKNLPAGTYTFSALVSKCTGSGYIQFIYSDNTNGPALNINGSGLFSFTANANKAINRVVLQANANSSILFNAVKVEIGSVQTLAYRDNNQWILTEIPNYATELLKCQRYFETSSQNINIFPNFGGNYTIPIINRGSCYTVKMIEKRVTPTIGIYSANAGTHGNVSVYKSGTGYVDAPAEIAYKSAKSFAVRNVVVPEGTPDFNLAQFHWIASADL